MFKNGRTHGKGVCWHDNEANLIRYDGDFFEDMWNGSGKYFRDSDGSVMYEGGFKNGQFHGQGRMYKENAELDYEGEFCMGQWHNEGKRYHNWEVSHSGEFDNGSQVD
jgi:hypothetical protein